MKKMSPNSMICDLFFFFSKTELSTYYKDFSVVMKQSLHKTDALHKQMRQAREDRLFLYVYIVILNNYQVRFLKICIFLTVECWEWVEGSHSLWVARRTTGVYCNFLYWLCCKTIIIIVTTICCWLKLIFALANSNNVSNIEQLTELAYK